MTEGPIVPAAADSSLEPPLVEIGITLAGIALLPGLVLANPELRQAFQADLLGDSAEVPVISGIPRCRVPPC